MFNRRFLLTALVWLASATAPLLAQPSTGTASGFVLDGQTGRPIAGVTIAINGQSSDKNLSDTDGRFKLVLSPGKYTINLTAPNYAAVEMTDDTQRVTFGLLRPLNPVAQ